MIGSVWWVASGSDIYAGRSAWRDLLTVINGVLPVIVFIVGIFIVWLEVDELRVENELKAEEKKAKTRKKK